MADEPGNVRNGPRAHRQVSVRARLSGDQNLQDAGTVGDYFCASQYARAYGEPLRSEGSLHALAQGGARALVLHQDKALQTAPGGPARGLFGGLRADHDR